MKTNVRYRAARAAKNPDHPIDTEIQRAECISASAVSLSALTAGTFGEFIGQCSDFIVGRFKEKIVKNFQCIGNTSLNVGYLSSKCLSGSGT